MVVEQQGWFPLEITEGILGLSWEMNISRTQNPESLMKLLKSSNL